MKRDVIILLLLICSAFSQAQQDMIWLRTMFSYQPSMMKYQLRLEDRLNMDLSNKTFLIDGRVSFGDKIQPILGAGRWYELEQVETRLYEGVECKGLRLMAEQRMFDDGTKFRFRGRFQFKWPITDQLRFITSQEVFFQQGWSHNRLCLTIQKDIKRLTIEGGYMLYSRTDYSFNTILIFLLWNI